MSSPSFDQVAAPRAAGFNCPNCGAGIELHAQGWAVSVACPSCGSVLDATDPNLSILQRHDERMRKASPRIPLGSRGTWHGAQWEAIGFQVVGINVDGTDYSWTEYVLFNPYRGFMYLSEYEGHWNVIEKLKRRPRPSSERGHVELDGRVYKHFQTATARTKFAAGEFPWELRVGDAVVAQDYVSAPYILSAEASEGETTWSMGTYTPSDVIGKAFNIEKGFISPIGVFANQPNPHTVRAGIVVKRCLALLALLFLMLMANLATSGSSQVLQERHTFERSGDEPSAAFVTDTFSLTGRPSAVQVRAETQLDNDWIFFVFSLINDSTGATLDATKQVSYYTGTDSDGSWSEGSRNGSVKFSSVPAGRYFLRVATEGGEPTKPSASYTLTVRRDVPGYGFYGLALLAIIVPAILLWIPAATFEQRRWAESDHASSSDSSDDEDEE